MVVYAVGASGVPGYGAAGVSSGLAAVGRSGGLVAGLALAVTAPLLAAWILGLLGLLVMRWLSERDARLRISVSNTPALIS